MIHDLNTQTVFILHRLEQVHIPVSPSKSCLIRFNVTICVVLNVNFQNQVIKAVLFILLKGKAGLCSG